MESEFNSSVDSQELFCLESQHEALTSQTISQVHNVIKKSKKTIKREKFTSSEKHILAKEVEKQRAIWDLGSELHCKADAVNRSWRIISSNMGKSVSDCKAERIALRESRRYRQKAVKQKKSGDAGGNGIEQPILDESVNIDWEYTDDLSFLPDISRKRKTLTTTTTTVSTQPDTDETADCNMLSPVSRSSNYSYIERPSPALSTTNMTNATRIANCIEKFVNSQTSPTEHQQPPLVHYTMLANIDRMMQQLPPNIVEDLNYEIITLCYKKIKEQNESSNK